MLAKIKRFFGTIPIVALLSTLGALLIVVSINARKETWMTLAGASLFAIGAMLSGNTRLYCLWGLLMTAPLDLSKRFMPLFHMGGESAFRVEASDFFLFALVGIMIADIAQDPRRRLQVPKPALFWFAAALLGVLNVVIGPWRLAAAHEVVRMIKILLLFLVIANTMIRHKQITQVVMGLLLFMGLQSILALVQYLFRVRLGLEVLGEPNPEALEGLAKNTLLGGKEVTRVGGLMLHPNVLAAYLSLLLPMSIALLFARVTTTMRIVCVGSMLLGEAALVATGSRSGWTSFAIGFLLVLVLSFVNPTMRKRYVGLRVIILISAVLVGLSFAGTIMDRLELSNPGSGSLRWRLVGDAWRMVLARPFFGHGLNSYVYAMAPYTMFTDLAGVIRAYGTNLPVVHNIYLLWWAEQGTVGLVLQLLVLFSFLRIGVLNLRIRDDVLFAVNIGAICGIVGLLLDGFFSFTLRFNSFCRVFWIVGGLIVAMRYWHHWQIVRANRPLPPESAESGSHAAA